MALSSITCPEISPSSTWKNALQLTPPLQGACSSAEDRAEQDASVLLLQPRHKAAESRDHVSLQPPGLAEAVGAKSLGTAGSRDGGSKR